MIVDKQWFPPSHPQNTSSTRFHVLPPRCIHLVVLLQLVLSAPKMDSPLVYLESLISLILGSVAQSLTCLATDACLTAVPGVTSLIPAPLDSSVTASIAQLVERPFSYRGFESCHRTIPKVYKMVLVAPLLTLA